MDKKELRNIKAPLTGSQRAMYSDQLGYLWEAWNRHNHRKHQLTQQMVELVDRLDSAGLFRVYRIHASKNPGRNRPTAPVSPLAGAVGLRRVKDSHAPEWEVSRAGQNYQERTSAASQTPRAGRLRFESQRPPAGPILPPQVAQ